ncbi:MAG: ABC-2 transporter permease [Oscillospiraceae bacterium]|nr:ABC-2 transporter permease [Oscillospiraceae bacterium]
MNYMGSLLYKEFTLARHATVLIFPLFGLMLLIPSYPYTVAFIYTCLEIFFIFLNGRENKDVLFTALLPVEKRDVVRARTLMIVIIQLFNILISVPFALIGRNINPLGENTVGIEANAAFYAIILIMFAIFNALFLPIFYKTGYSAGRALCFAGGAASLWLIAAEVAVQLIPALKTNLDNWLAAGRPLRLALLGAAALIYFAATLTASRRAQALFERVDL